MTRKAFDLDRHLADLGCEALLVLAEASVDPDLAPFVGTVHLGQSFLVAPRGGRPRLGYLTPMERGEAAATDLDLLDPDALEVPRWTRDGLEPGDLLAAVLERALALCEIVPGRLAVAGHGAAGVVWSALSRLSRAGWSFASGNDLVRRRRKTKSAGEVEAIRAAAKGAVAAFRALVRLLAAASERGGELWLEGERLRVGRLRAEVAQTLARHGLEQPRGNILAPAEEGGVPHSTGSPERVLRPGESLVVDLFPRGRLFADCTRTFCVGVPPEPLARAQAAVAAALAQAFGQARPGARGWDLQAEVCAYLGSAGYPTPVSHPGTTNGYVHGLGHGVGYELHEYPSFRKQTGAEGLLEEGDVFTLEPGLYEPQGAEAEGGGWGVRLEDLVVLGPEGPENLTPLPYDLDPRAWNE